MIGWLLRRLLPGNYRKREMDDVIHDRRNEAQVAKLQTHLLRTARETRERLTPLEDTYFPPHRRRP